MKRNQWKTAIGPVLGVLAVAVSFFGTAHAQDTRKVLNAGVVNYYVPYEFKDPKTGELKGFTHDLVEAMAKKMGVKVNFIEFSWADLASFAPLKTGRVDFYGSGIIGDTPERRESGVSFLDFAYEPYSFFTLRTKADQFKTPADFCGKQIANSRTSTLMVVAVTAWSEENCVKAGKPAVIQAGATNMPEQILMLKQGRVDAGFTGVGPVQSANETGDNAFAIVGQPLARIMYGMAFPNEKKALGDSLKKALDEVIADGTYAELFRKWNLPVESSSIGATSSINAGQSVAPKK